MQLANYGGPAEPAQESSSNSLMYMPRVKEVDSASYANPNNNISMKAAGANRNDSQKLQSKRKKDLSNFLTGGYSHKYQEKKHHSKGLTSRNNASGHGGGNLVNSNSQNRGGQYGLANIQSPAEDAKGLIAAGLMQEGPGEISKVAKHVGRLENILGSTEQLDKVKKLHQLYAGQIGKAK